MQKSEKSPVSEQESGTVRGVEGALSSNSSSVGDKGISSLGHTENFRI